MSQANLTKSAQSGDAASCYQLALLYHRGAGVPKDLKQAARWYRMSAERGFLKAQTQLASMYMRGEGLPMQVDKAAYWFEKAAEQGDPESSQQLSMMYAEGVGVGCDFNKALYWYEKFTPEHSRDYEMLNDIFSRVAFTGHPSLQVQLGWLQENGAVPGHRKDAINWYRTAASSGEQLGAQLVERWERRNAGSPAPDHRDDAELRVAAEAGCVDSCYELGRRLLDGDRAQAVVWLERGANHYAIDCVALLGQIEHSHRDKWLRKAAMAGNVTAQYDLAKQLEMRSDLKNARRWYEAAAANGHLAAQHELAELMLSNNEFETASKLLQHAAEGGDVTAQLRLAEMYARGEGVERDQKTSLVYTLMAAQNGSSRAQYDLALSDPNMLGSIAAPEVQAVDWLRRAAEGGEVRAKSLLGRRLYDEAAQRGDEPALEEALVWLMDAAQRLDFDATLMLAEHFWKRDDALRGLEYAKLAGDRLRAEADEGNTRAMVLYARCLLHEGKTGEGLHWMHEAANSGSGFAASMLAEQYAVGDLLPKDNQKALEYFIRAAELDPAAEEQLSKWFAKTVEDHGGDAENAIFWLQRGAERGNADALFNLAEMYFYGHYVDLNLELAVELYEQAAALNHCVALLQLADCYLLGEGVEPDSAKAIQYYALAAQGGNVQAQFNLAAAYESGDGVDQDLGNAYKLYESAAKAGHGLAQIRLAVLMDEQHNDVDGAFRWLEKAAQSGVPEALQRMARVIRQDPWREVAANYDAISLLRKAVTLQHVEAAIDLSELLLQAGDPLSLAEAHNVLRCAASAGLAEAYYQLGQLAYCGLGIQRDLALAAKYYEQAVELGCKKSCFVLALMYMNGVGVNENAEQAFSLCKMAAEAGQAEAQYYLGLMYLSGEVGTAQPDQAQIWLEQAAAQGNAEAAKYLAQM